MPHQQTQVQQEMIKVLRPVPKTPSPRTPNQANLTEQEDPLLAVSRLQEVRNNVSHWLSRFLDEADLSRYTPERKTTKHLDPSRPILKTMTTSPTRKEEKAKTETTKNDERTQNVKQTETDTDDGGPKEDGISLVSMIGVIFGCIGVLFFLLAIALVIFQVVKKKREKTETLETAGTDSTQDTWDLSTSELAPTKAKRASRGIRFTSRNTASVDETVPKSTNTSTAPATTTTYTKGTTTLNSDFATTDTRSSTLK